MDTKKRLENLRQAMTGHDLAAYLQPVHDEYLSEYPPASNRRVQWLTGFSGSAGTAVVAKDKAVFFTDGRYTLQAKNEVDGKLFELHNIADMFVEEWLACSLPASPLRGEETMIRVGYDPKLYTQDMLKRMQKVLSKKRIGLVPVSNVVDQVWKDRPAAPASMVFVHEVKYAGESSADKRKRMAEKIVKAGAEVALITAPESVCWLLNIRGSDIEHTPLVLAHALLDSQGKVQLFVDSSRCDDEVKVHLKEVELHAPAKLEAGLMALKKTRVLCDPAAVPVWFTQVLNKAGAEIVEGQDPILLAKAIKNPVELQGMRESHIRDGVAVTKLLAWVDREAARREVSEIEVAEMLLSLRQSHFMFREPSFPTIAGSGPHGAIVHYRATPESNRALRQGELLLLDSGGQYPDGTTDITRTIPIGNPTPEQKDRFTRVLKGHIAIATAVFPEGTSGSQLDALARQYLWQAGLDYDHGTGHGVGHFLGVHEGPQRISKRGGDAKLLPGMIVSNEPGYYKAGEYGIRVESLVAVGPLPNPPPLTRERGLASPSPAQRGRAGEGGFLGFETITCAPIDTRLIEPSLLTETEKHWLNAYHAWVLEKLSDALDEHERIWLAERCAPV